MSKLSEIIDQAISKTWSDDIWFVQPVAPKGAYRRRRPIAIFDENATPATQDVVRQYCEALQQTYPSLKSVALREASTVGQGAVLTRSQKLVWETVREFTSQGQVPDGFLEGEAGELRMRSSNEVSIRTPCLLVKRPWYRNYGHWLVDGAALIALMADTVMREGLTVVVGQQESTKMSEVVRDTLATIIPEVPLIVAPDDEKWTFSDLRCVTPVHVPPLFKFPAALGALRNSVLRDRVSQRYRRLFISRGNAAPRALINEDELFEICRSLDFVRVQPEKLTFREQAELFADAEIVVGVKGAALANCLFCRSEAKVIVMSPDGFPDPFFWDICGQMDICYAEIYGASIGEGRAAKRPFIVDPHRLSELIDIVLSSS